MRGAVCPVRCTSLHSTVDSGGKSRFGAHTDTPQILPCLCSADSMYPPGFFPYVGAEMCFMNGMYADDYGREGAVLGNFHRTLHAPMPLRAYKNTPQCAAGLPMLRGSTVLWTHAGETYPGLRDQYRERRDVFGEDAECADMKAQRRVLRVIARQVFMPSEQHRRCTRGSSEEEELGAAELEEYQEVSEGVVGPLGMQMRLNGGAPRLRSASKKKKCTKKNY